ncbi:hypothetical protein ACFV4P_35525 [Kitasatospora sp. NPDC059795]|uniref:hypothetical protein n=1 Tax=Kitasatospora sp. NPDC059795 TaxID=3346949 RepID=UPI003647BB78
MPTRSRIPSQRNAAERPAFGSVYTLTDPRDGRVRYVGQTEKSLQVRLAGHIKQPTNDAMRLWLMLLMAHGLTPAIDEVRRARVEDLLDVEREYIEYYAQKGDLLNSPYNVVHLPALGAEVNELFAARVGEDGAAEATVGQVVPPIVITVPGPSAPADGGQTTEEQVPQHQHSHHYSFSLGGASARRRPLRELRYNLRYRWRWSRNVHFEISWAARQHPWAAFAVGAVLAALLWQAVSSMTAAYLAQSVWVVAEGSVGPLLATVSDPVDRFITARSQGVPASASVLQVVWWAAAAVIVFTGLLRGAWSRRLAWTAHGSATFAMVWLGSDATSRPIACGVVGLLWVLALAFV